MSRGVKQDRKQAKMLSVRKGEQPEWREQASYPPTNQEEPTTPEHQLTSAEREREHRYTMWAGPRKARQGHNITTLHNKAITILIRK